ncbi:MAG: YlxR family protein [Tissierellia bacterium]|nr:YlxR family protein [Tissierellia bacterium]
MKTNKEHLRKCIACQNHMDKKDLLRIVRNKEGVISIDLTGKQNGRGAYICKNKACLEKTIKNKLLNRSLKANATNELYQEIENYVDER